MTVVVQFDQFTLEKNQNRILKGVSLTIREGEKIALVGPSGAGKSTLLDEIFKRVGDRAALCPQQLGLVDALSAYHNIYMAQLERHFFLINLWNLFFPLGSARQQISSLADAFGLEGLLDRSVFDLSGGEKQRVALARACYREKTIFLGDEPVSSLDPEQGQQLLNRIGALHSTVVVALHSPKLALGNFDRVIGLRGGELKFDLGVSELSADFLAGFYRGQ